MVAWADGAHGRAPAPVRPFADAEALSGWRVRLADAEALEQGLYASLARRPDADLSACVEEMTAYRQTALETLLTAARTIRPGAPSSPAFAPSSTARPRAGRSSRR